jgi:beta-lactamase class A
MDPYTRRRHKPKHRHTLLYALLVIGIVALLLVIFMNRSAKPVVSDKDKSSKTVQTNNNQPTAEKPKPKLVDLQPTVDGWVATQSGEYGIAVYDPANKKTIATHEADTQFFTASIYKLYAVYLALEDIEAGKHTLDEAFRAGKSRQTCIHDAIHTSDSPCAEALLNEIGQAETNERLKAFGFTGTSFPGFVTTASDSIKILQRIQERKDLEKSSTDIMLNAMKTQVYRDGMPKGMPEATVYDKVGFSEVPHYHDVAIIELPSGRQYLVAFLSKGTGSRPVADFASTIYAALKE